QLLTERSLHIRPSLTITILVREHKNKQINRTVCRDSLDIEIIPYLEREKDGWILAKMIIKKVRSLLHNFCVCEQFTTIILIVWMDRNRKKISKHCFSKPPWPNDKRDYCIALNEISNEKCFIDYS